jgi:hypothetical protein
MLRRLEEVLEPDQIVGGPTEADADAAKVMVTDADATEEAEDDVHNER